MRGFRAWHTKLNRYLKDDEFFIGADGKVRNDSFGRGNYEEAFDTSDFDNGYIILEQDTGLKDKNGKPIYDGDIVDDGYSNICEIRWREKCAGFKVVNENDGYVTNVWFVSKYGEVIGNIHENPELLEEEE